MSLATTGLREQTRGALFWRDREKISRKLQSESGNKKFQKGRQKKVPMTVFSPLKKLTDNGLEETEQVVSVHVLKLGGWVSTYL